MILLPDPQKNTLLGGAIRDSHPVHRGRCAQIADHIAALERRTARRARLYWQLEHASVLPARWFRPQPRASIQYAGHISTEAARDPRLSRGAVSLLLILRARAGHGTETDTTKTTLAHTLHVTTRTIGRWLRDLVRFGYVEASARIGKSGLYTGLHLWLCEKVLPCFRKLPWLTGWLAQNLGGHGGNPDRTELSDTNHPIKESSTKGHHATPPRRS